MGRTELLQEFKVADGKIVSPGKFENEPLYAPYFYALALDGGAEETDTDMFGQESIAYLNVTPDDVKEFPELADVRQVQVFEDESGFVYCKPREEG